MPTTAISFLAHPSGNESWSVVSDFLADVRQAKPAWRVGASVLLARYKEATSRDHALAFEPNATFVLADPETHKMELPFPSRGRGRDDLAYLKESSPRANISRFVANVLQAQVNNGRSILLSPWLVHGAAPNARNLQATVAFAQAAAASQLVNGRELWFGFQVTQGVVADNAERNALLNELVELPTKPIYLRVQVDAPDGPRQFADGAVIAGLRQLVEGLRSNGVRVVLPQSGLLGWLMLPLGAVSFGAGTRTSMQRTTALTTGGFARQPLNWYFVPQFLGIALAEEMPQIARVSTFQPCDCPYCGGQLPPTGAAFDRVLAGKHYLWWCAKLASELNGKQPLAEVQRRIASAQAFWTRVQGSSVVLDDRSQPQHLANWLAAIS